MVLIPSITQNQNIHCGQNAAQNVSLAYFWPTLQVYLSKNGVALQERSMFPVTSENILLGLWRRTKQMLRRKVLGSIPDTRNVRVGQLWPFL